LVSATLATCSAPRAALSRASGFVPWPGADPRPRAGPRPHSEPCDLAGRL